VCKKKPSSGRTGLKIGCPWGRYILEGRKNSGRQVWRKITSNTMTSPAIEMILRALIRDVKPVIFINRIRFFDD